MKKILFQGDSITDASRMREHPYNLGQGYPNFVAGRLGLQYPGEYEFQNRGISGNRIVDLYARSKCDILNLAPDYMSILIGVNDVWHEQHDNGVSAPKFKKIYGMLLEELLDERPQMKILLVEPFVMKGTATSEKFDWFLEEVMLRARAVEELAAQYQLPFLPIQRDLNRLATIAPVEHWLAEGVHPTVYFHQYLADRWIEIFEKTK